jgi:HEAT repeat associated with sister chromatid cohesion
VVLTLQCILILPDKLEGELSYN